MSDPTKKNCFMFGNSWQERDLDETTGRDKRNSKSREDSTQGGDEVFLIERADAYAGVAPQLGRPQVLGQYSLDAHRNISFNVSQPKFVDKDYMPRDDPMEVQLDLNRGMEKAGSYDGTTEANYHNFLKWIMSQRDTLAGRQLTSSPSSFASIFCMKNTLTMIMKSPNNTKDEWTIDAKIFRGSLYLVSWKMKEEISFMLNRKVEVYGHKFLQYLTKGDPEAGVELNQEFRCVMELELAGTKLIFPINVDCADSELYQDGFKDLSAFIMIKTSTSQIEGDFSYSRYQMQHWWLENQLSGIPHLVIGHKNRSGVVKHLQLIKMDQLPEMAKGMWKSEVCISFLASFLAYVRRKVEEQPTALHRFQRESRDCIRHSIVLPGTTTQDSHFDLLPCWYQDYMLPTPPSTS